MTSIKTNGTLYQVYHTRVCSTRCVCKSTWTKTLTLLHTNARNASYRRFQCEPSGIPQKGYYSCENCTQEPLPQQLVVGDVSLLSPCDSTAQKTGASPYTEALLSAGRGHYQTFKNRIFSENPVQRYANHSRTGTSNRIRA